MKQLSSATSKAAQLAVTLTTMVSTVLFSSVAFAQDANQTELWKWQSIGAALAIGLAAFGGALGQGKAAAAALEGIARNPNSSGKMTVPLILGLALIESLVIYALVIAAGWAGPNGLGAP